MNALLDIQFMYDILCYFYPLIACGVLASLSFSRFAQCVLQLQRTADGGANPRDGWIAHSTIADNLSHSGQKRKGTTSNPNGGTATQSKNKESKIQREGPREKGRFATFSIAIIMQIY